MKWKNPWEHEDINFVLDLTTLAPIHLIAIRGTPWEEESKALEAKNQCWNKGREKFRAEPGQSLEQGWLL